MRPQKSQPRGSTGLQRAGERSRPPPVAVVDVPPVAPAKAVVGGFLAVRLISVRGVRAHLSHPPPACGVGVQPASAGAAGYARELPLSV